jgi:hypothetical protein
MTMKFPEKVYTETEHKAVKKLIDEGYKHEVTVEGETEFTHKANRILELIKTAGYYEFFRTYIRQVKEIDGITQLRETEVAIWANKFAVENPIDAASLFIQKAYHMKQYIDGEMYYGGASEKMTVGKRIEFLKTLETKTDEKEVKEECERLLQLWAESSLAP